MNAPTLCPFSSAASIRVCTSWAYFAPKSAGSQFLSLYFPRYVSGQGAWTETLTVATLGNYDTFIISHCVNFQYLYGHIFLYKSFVNHANNLV